MFFYNHIFGIPQKEGKEYPLFDYQKRFIEALENNKRVACFKCRAAGITELALRYAGYLCVKDDRLKGTNIVIVSAPAEQLSISFIRRLKAHHSAHIEFDTRENLAILNGVRIESFPSHNLSRLRGITNVSMLILEESDFWHESEQQAILETALPIIG